MKKKKLERSSSEGQRSYTMLQELKRINICSVSPVRYSGYFLNWTREELRNITLTVRKIMAIHKVLHQKMIQTQEEGKRHTSLEDWVNSTIYINRERHRHTTDEGMDSYR